MVAIGLLAWISGFLAASAIHRTKPWLGLLTNVICLIAAILTWVWFNRRLEALAKERDQLRQGETAEIAIARQLASLPDTYFIIHGLSTRSGDLDHIVVGPTGVFAIDTKSWKGTVTTDGKGELLLNGSPTEKPEINNSVRRVMGIKDRVKALSPELDPYIKAVFVFTSARVEAKWGTTGALHCIRDSQLLSYIEDNKPPGGTISRANTKTIARAFKALADMDSNVTQTKAGRSNAKEVGMRNPLKKRTTTRHQDLIRKSPSSMLYRPVMKFR